MSLQVPIRLKITQGGVTLGYVETLDFSAGATVTGPVASIASGGGGGDADTLQGHPASFFATDADLTAAEVDIATISAQLAALVQRALMWANLGIAVQASDPGSGITYAQWVGGATGFWGWIKLP